MPIDPTLAQGIAPINIAGQDPNAKWNRLAMMMKLGAMQSEQQTNALTARKVQGELDAQQALQAALASGDPTALARVPGGAGILKDRAAAQASEATARKTVVDQKLGQYKQLFGLAQTPDHLAEIFTGMAQDPDIGPGIAQTMHPEWVLGYIKAHPDKFGDIRDQLSGMTPKDIYGARVAQMGAETAGVNAETARINAKAAEARANKENLGPTSAQEAEWYVKATPEQREAYDKMHPPAGGGAGGLSPVGKLIRDRDALPPDSPDRVILDNAIRNETQSNVSKLDERTKAKFEQAYPKVNASVKAFDAETKDMLRVIDQLASHPGTERITGGLGGVNAYTPNITEAARDAQAIYDRLLGMGQFKALTDLRQNSPTGAGVGNVSDFEGRTLRDSFAALARTQGTKAFKSELDNLKARLTAAQENVHSAFDDTYAYRNEATGGGGAPATVTTKEAYDALPSGADFIAPDGSHRRKP